MMLRACQHVRIVSATLRCSAGRICVNWMRNNASQQAVPMPITPGHGISATGMPTSAADLAAKTLALTATGMSERMTAPAASCRLCQRYMRITRRGYRPMLRSNAWSATMLRFDRAMTAMLVARDTMHSIVMSSSESA